MIGDHLPAMLFDGSRDGSGVLLAEAGDLHAIERRKERRSSGIARSLLHGFRLLVQCRQLRAESISTRLDGGKISGFL